MENRGHLKTYQITMRTLCIVLIVKNNWTKDTALLNGCKLRSLLCCTLCEQMCNVSIKECTKLVVLTIKPLSNQLLTEILILLINVFFSLEKI